MQMLWQSTTATTTPPLLASDFHRSHVLTTCHWSVSLCLLGFPGNVEKGVQRAAGSGRPPGRWRCGQTKNLAVVETRACRHAREDDAASASVSDRFPTRVARRRRRQRRGRQRGTPAHPTHGHGSTWLAPALVSPARRLDGQLGTEPH